MKPITVNLTGEDVNRFEYLQDYYSSLGIDRSVSAIMRLSIRKQYKEVLSIVQSQDKPVV